MAENNLIASYVFNVCTVIYRKCSGTKFKFGLLSATPHSFFKVKFLETLCLVR